MSPTRRAVLILTAGFAMTAFLLALPGQERKPAGTRYAILIACSGYNKTQLRPLPYTINDVEEFKKALLATGYDEENIVVMHDKLPQGRFHPEAAKLRRELALFLKGMQPGDSLVVALSGHGVHYKGETTGYFCPVDARLSDRKTLLPMDGDGGLFEVIKSCKARQKLLLVNACRNDPTSDLAQAADKINLEDEYPETVPEGIAAIYSCEKGEKSYYDDERKCGIFFLHATAAWRGAYQKPGDGPLTLERYFEQVRTKTKADVFKNLGEPQNPDVRRQYDGRWVIHDGGGKPPDLDRTTRDNPGRLEVPLKRGGKLVLEFVRIPKGTFRMGSPASERADLKKRYDYDPKDEDEHEVEITRDYWLGKTTVTRGQFRVFVEDDGYSTEGEQDGKGGYGWTGTTWEQKPEFTWKNAGFDQTDDHPVVLVSWNDAKAFCDWLKRKTGKAVGLPTEAEWERACRGGERKGRYFFGDDEEDLARQANVADASFRAATKKDWGIQADDGYAFTAPVGKFRANQYGLYDMHGNVWQWCQDWYDKDYYANSDKRDPQGPNHGMRRVLRGGSWNSDPGDCRAAGRDWRGPATRSDIIGFRLVFRLD